MAGVSTNEQVGKPTGGMPGQTHVDYQRQYTRWQAAIEFWNAGVGMQAALLQRLVEQGTELKIEADEHTQRFIQTPDGFVMERQRRGYWVLDVPLVNFELAMEWKRYAFQDARQEKLDAYLKGTFVADEELRSALIYNVVTYNGTGTGLGNAGINAASGLWNGTTSKLTPPPFRSRKFASSHTHYNKTASATAITLADINAQRETILHHGYGGQMVATIPTTMMTKIADLFQATVMLPATPIVPTIQVEGFPSTGLKLQGFDFFVDEMVPDDYVVMFAMGAPPLFERLHPESAYRGLQFEPGSYVQNPLRGGTFFRRTGMVVKHKGAGVVLNMAGSYANPHGLSPNPYSFDYV